MTDTTNEYLVHAMDMTPGHIYQGTADGPIELDGVTFTVLATVSFELNGAPVRKSHWDDDAAEYGVYIQVAYDAWAYPFPEVATFAPFDCVIPVNKDWGIGESYVGIRI